MKKLPKSLTTVTSFSKLLALFLFILFPFFGFYIGMKYQKELDVATITKPSTTKIIKQLVYITPQPSPTPISFLNWKTYQNMQFSYSVKYRSDAEKKDISKTGYRGLLDLVNLSYSKGYSVMTWKNYNISVTDEKSLKDWLEKSSGDSVSGTLDLGFLPLTTKDRTVTSTSVSGYPAFELPDWGIKTVFIPHKNYVYELLFDGNRAYYDSVEVAQDKKAADYVLSTFRFLD